MRSDEPPIFGLTKRGVLNLARRVRRSELWYMMFNLPGEVRLDRLPPKMVFYDEYAWGWSRWVLRRENYPSVEAAVESWRNGVLTELVEMVHIAVTDPARAIDYSRDEIDPLTALMRRVKRNNRREVRSAWIKDQPDARTLGIPREMFEALARAATVWEDTSSIVSKVPELTTALLGLHGRMYAALGAAPRWDHPNLPKVIDQMHRYCDVIEWHAKKFERQERAIEREREVADPAPIGTVDAQVRLDEAEDELQRHKQRIQAYEELRIDETGWRQNS